MFQDHCGALPYMTEMVGYKGPIYMTHPTKAIAPILLEDMRKVAVERKGETNFFTSAMIRECMKKVVAVNLHQVGECWKTFLKDFFITFVDRTGIFVSSDSNLEAYPNDSSYFCREKFKKSLVSHHRRFCKYFFGSTTLCFPKPKGFF